MAKLGKSALYYRRNKLARDKKKAYDTKYESTPDRVAYRTNLNRERIKRKLKGDERDLSHKSDGSIGLEDKSKNRRRQGADGKSTLKKA